MASSNRCKFNELHSSLKVLKLGISKRMPLTEGVYRLALWYPSGCSGLHKAVLSNNLSDTTKPRIDTPSDRQRVQNEQHSRCHGNHEAAIVSVWVGQLPRKRRSDKVLLDQLLASATGATKTYVKPMPGTSGRRKLMAQNLHEVILSESNDF